MITKQEIQAGNQYAQNEWPWYSDELDRDVEQYLAARGANGLDISYDEVGGRKVQVPFHFTPQQLRTLLTPHFAIEELRDSVYFSSVLADPAKAHFLVLRNGQ